MSKYEIGTIFNIVTCKNCNTQYKYTLDEVTKDGTHPYDKYYLKCRCGRDMDVTKTYKKVWDRGEG